MNKKIYMLLFGGLPAKPTGIANSVIRRSNALVKDGTPNEILVYRYYNNFDSELKLLRESGKLDPRVNVRFMYNDLAYESEVDDRQPIVRSPEEDGYIVIQDPSKKHVYRCYKNGLYLKFKWYNEDGSLNFVDYLQPNFVRERREWFDPKGYVKKIEYMDPATNKPARMILLNKEGKCYLSYAMSPKTGKVTQILWFGKDGEYKAEFKDENQLLQYWLQNFILTNQDEYSLLISEYGFKKPYLSKLQKDKLSIIYTFHNTHFKEPYTYGSAIRDEHVEFLNSLHETEAVVFLTKEQKDDIVSQFGNSDKVHVIPHHAEKVSVTDSKREARTVVCLGRFESIKNHAHAVKAFKYVVEKVPDAVLELYGRGAEEENLKKLIKELQLEKNVFIKGFTSNSYGVFERAAISLIPSDYEGICLSLMESMACGCPVISYDFKYGPQDIIKNDINGGIVPKGDIISLANKIIELLNNQEKRKTLSLNAKEITNTFSEERLIREWNELFDKLMKQEVESGTF